MKSTDHGCHHDTVVFIRISACMPALGYDHIWPPQPTQPAVNSIATLQPTYFQIIMQVRSEGGTRELLLFTASSFREKSTTLDSQNGLTH